MIDKEMEASKKSFAAPLFLSGAVVGAILGVLLAPDSGKETRRKLSGWLKEKARKGREELEHEKRALVAAVTAGKEAYQKDEKKHLVAH